MLFALAIRPLRAPLPRRSTVIPAQITFFNYCVNYTFPWFAGWTCLHILLLLPATGVPSSSVLTSPGLLRTRIFERACWHSPSGRWDIRFSSLFLLSIFHVSQGVVRLSPLCTTLRIQPPLLSITHLIYFVLVYLKLLCSLSLSLLLVSLQYIFHIFSTVLSHRIPISDMLLFPVQPCQRQQYYWQSCILSLYFIDRHYHFSFLLRRTSLKFERKYT